MQTVTVESIPILVGREDDGRWWADIESMPGVMTYGANQRLTLCVHSLCALPPTALTMAKKCPRCSPRSSRWHEPLAVGKGKTTVGLLSALWTLFPADPAG